MSGDSQVRTLFGRDAELDLIDRLIGASAILTTPIDSRMHSRTGLLLGGEPGIGKSALLDAAAVAAATSGVLALRATGVEFESGLPYSGLEQVLAPLEPNPLVQNLQALRPDGPSGTDRSGLSTASGPSAGAPAGWLAVGNAALEVLLSASAVRPLLVLVDDVQWLDPPSAAVLAFISRRLAHFRIGFIAATRTGSDGPLNRAGLPPRLLRPLDDASAALLVGSRFPALAGRVQQRVLAEANGNPLALVELPLAMTEGQRTDAEPLPAVLPLTRRLSALFLGRLTQLPAPCRELLLLAALDGTGSVDVLAAATGVGGVERLAPAERSRLIVLERGGRLAFRHPLARAAVVELATPIERRRAHLFLAEFYSEHSNHRAWHLAEASIRPDERIAALLEGSAHLNLRQGDAVGAISVLTRAAELSPDRSHRGRRLAEAAYIDADVAGGLARVSRLRGDAAVTDPGADRPLLAAVADACLQLNADGHVQTAQRLLVAAIDRHRQRRAGVGAELAEALHTLLFGCFFAGRDGVWEQFTSRLADAGPGVPPALAIGASTFADPARAQQVVLRRLDALIADLRDESDPTVIVRCGMAAIYVDRLAGCRSALRRVVRDGRAGGAITSAIDALMLLCFDDLASGQWLQAGRLADEALNLCSNNGYRLLSWPGLLARALLAAARGEVAVVTDLAARMQAWAVPRGVGIVRDYARQATTLATTGQGDFEQAFRQASAISAAGSLAPYAPQALWVALDLVESAVRTGRRESAVAHVAAMDAAGIAAISPRLALVAAGCRAIAGADKDARALFEHALAVPGAERWPFEFARLQLCFGEFLRRQRDDEAALDQFAAAQQSFQRLQATPWIARASRGVRATGVPVRPSDATGPVQLSPQQLQIATLAGSGLTNRQIGERLHLSHRTVGAHLYRLYPQLGVTSRAGLRGALADLPAPHRHDVERAVR